MSLLRILLIHFLSKKLFRICLKPIKKHSKVGIGTIGATKLTH